MHIYLGLFAVAFSALALEVTLVRLLSVTTWYHLSFFAISTAMLGMTAGATKVYLRPNLFRPGELQDALALSAIKLALSIPVTLVLLCLVPLSLWKNVMSLLSILVTTAACALPFYFTGMIISAILTKYDLPIGRLYASDLLGASLGCLFVLGGLEIVDAPSLILWCSAVSALGGLCFAWRGERRWPRAALLGLLVLFAVAGGLNSLTRAGIRPMIVKGQRIEPAMQYLLERWNSFSRIAVYPRAAKAPFYWGASALAPRHAIERHEMNIDGEAGTVMVRFRSTNDIEHLKFDVTNVGYHLGRKGRACIIGVGGGRDLQSALLFGHQDVTGVEINPIFIDLLQNEFRDFAGLAGNPRVALVKAEARSYLSQATDRYAVIQMSLIDTWAATGAGAFSLSENSLYTVEAWTVFLNRLTPDGIFSVSRWHSPERMGETGRVIALALGALLRQGIQEPAKHLVLITTDRISTLLVSRSPFTDEDLRLLSEVCAHYRYRPTLLPGQPVKEPLFERLLAARTYADLVTAAQGTELNYTPTTDETPYFFNMLRLSKIRSALKAPPGVIHGNLVATLTLLGLLLALAFAALVTIVLPLLFRARVQPAATAPAGALWWGAFYFALIGAAFMLTEIALIQRLTVLLSHPIYALGILLFTIIASTGIGSLLSDRLPLARRPWIYLYPLVTAAGIVALRFLLTAVLRHLVTADLALRIAVSVAIISPLGLLLGLFFPTGMGLAKSAHPADTPWYWALNGILGVLCSVLAVFISIYLAVSVNFYIAAVCYAAALIPLEQLRRQASRAPYAT